MVRENLHDSDDRNSNQPRRVETCDIDAIESDAIREVARRWRRAGRRIEAGNQLTGDYVFDIETGVSVYEHAGKYVASDDGDRDPRFDSPRDAAQMAVGYLEAVEAGGDA
ncbi:hypothetical protein [Halopiger xanaduensis]|uniref:Uncharacterized protein n=1 Tax=Halopiger xanaduensis (strain DSM 18323 / JCM 14033 / SH-6) TaxID=797210 RepID=F8D674_HALXS|nr:hypothetical protein [Halopiger xanaduensis]AEH35590.1 hypothetical protein Halxa_0954 [Halopiger xanaduensis SH-6]